MYPFIGNEDVTEPVESPAPGLGLGLGLSDADALGLTLADGSSGFVVVKESSLISLIMSFLHYKRYLHRFLIVGPGHRDRYPVINGNRV
jgi:hypothetical protein